MQNMTHLFNSLAPGSSIGSANGLFVAKPLTEPGRLIAKFKFKAIIVSCTFSHIISVSGHLASRYTVPLPK